MNAFSHIAATLVRCASARPRRQYGDEPTTKVEAMRRALGDGPMSAHDLAKVAGVPSALVSALLKHDIVSGRVAKRPGRGGGMLYELSSEFEADLQRKLHEARMLLERHGFAVSRTEAA